MIILLIDYVERINDDRWDTWVCIEPKCGIDYDESQMKRIEKEILEHVNKCKTNEFYNSNTGNSKYKYAIPVCECGDNPVSKEHWILSNSEFDKE